jgi:hypothetical protein
MARSNCFQSRQVTGECDICKERAEIMHMPLRPLGFYCEKHCPVCPGGGRVIIAPILQRRQTPEPRRNPTVVTS